MSSFARICLFALILQFCGAWLVPLVDRRAALQLGLATTISPPKLFRKQPHTILSPTRIAYDNTNDQFGELWLPGQSVQSSKLPVVALLHGGFWQNEYDLSLMDNLAANIAAAGHACWNIEYRRVGSSGWSSYRDTMADVSAALEWTASEQARTWQLHPNRLVLAGHSAGGTLAMWAALRPLLPTSCPSRNTNAAVSPRAVVSLGGVMDLAWAEEQRQGGKAVDQFMGRPPPYPCGSPIDLLPPVSQSLRQQAARDLQQPDCVLGLVHADADDVVPVAQSIRFTVAACTAGFEVELHRVRSDDHFSCLDPTSASWLAARAILERGIAGDVPQYTSSSLAMLPTTRDQTPTSVVIRTRRAHR